MKYIVILEKLLNKVLFRLIGLKRGKMNKKGQFYIFIAVLLCIAIFIIISQVNRLEERVLLEDFQELSKNYASEAPKVVNYALKEESKGPGKAKDPGKALDKFTNDFTTYARTIDPNIGFVYIYRDRTTKKVKIANYLPEETIKIKGCEDDPSKCNIFDSDTTTINDINLKLGDQLYKYSVPSKLKNFDESFYSLESTGMEKINLEIGGIPYNFDMTDKNFIAVAEKSVADQNLVQVDITEE